MLKICSTGCFRQLANRLLANLARDPELVPLADVLEVAGGKTFHPSELVHQVRIELIEKNRTPIRLGSLQYDIGAQVPIKPSRCVGPQPPP